MCVGISKKVCWKMNVRGEMWETRKYGCGEYVRMMCWKICVYGENVTDDGKCVENMYEKCVESVEMLVAMSVKMCGKYVMLEKICENCEYVKTGNMCINVD